MEELSFNIIFGASGLNLILKLLTDQPWPLTMYIGLHMGFIHISGAYIEGANLATFRFRPISWRWNQTKLISHLVCLLSTTSTNVVAHKAYCLWQING